MNDVNRDNDDGDEYARDYDDDRTTRRKLCVPLIYVCKNTHFQYYLSPSCSNVFDSTYTALIILEGYVCFKLLLAICVHHVFLLERELLKES